MTGMHPLGSPLRRLRRERTLSRHPIEEAAWNKTLADHPILRGLEEGERSRLRDFATVFLREKRFEPPQGFVLDDETKLSIAVQACLPVLGLGFDWIGDWSSVIVHPDEFVERRHDLDEAGVMHEYDDPLTGEAHPFGPIVLSIADVKASGWGDGYNVVVHEVAHKLDMREGGVANGCPPLHADMDRSAWQAVFARAFEDLRGSRRKRRAIDSYAAENPSEFFAVMSEYFFEDPRVIVRDYREVYGLLESFYRQSTLGRLSGRRAP